MLKLISMNFFFKLLPESNNYLILLQVAPLIKGRAVKEGTMMISYNPLKSRGWVNFFRVIVHCIPTLSEEYMDNIILQVQKYGQDL